MSTNQGIQAIYPLKAAFTITEPGLTPQLVTEVPIMSLFQRDRIAAEKHAANDPMGQDDFMLHRMTGIPVKVIPALPMVDSDALLRLYIEMGGLDVDEEADSMVEAGTVYPLAHPIQTIKGELTELRLMELTRGDQKHASQYSKWMAEQDSFLIGKMTALQVEDVAKMHVRDVYALRGLFRRVITTRKTDAQNRPGTDAGAQGIDAGQPVADAHA